jgi:hypothetical protein
MFAACTGRDFRCNLNATVSSEKARVVLVMFLKTAKRESKLNVFRHIHCQSIIVASTVRGTPSSKQELLAL